MKTREEYCLENSLKPSAAREKLAQHTRKNIPHSNMLIGELEGAFFQVLVKSSGVKNILEIGTYTGYSALTFAEALPQDGRILTLDINPETTEVAKSFWKESPHAHKIEAFVGNGKEKIQALISENKKFDLIFIDADKENYPEYVRLGKNLLNKGGMLVLDNVLWDNRVLDPANTEGSTLGIKKATSLIVDDSATWDFCMLPVRDGVMMARLK